MIRIKHRKLLALLPTLLLTVPAWPALAADWKPAQGPLSTRWTTLVKAENPLPEYPRPQLVRAEWQNLNGLWQFAFGKQGDAPPVGKVLDGQILVPFPVESALSGVMKHADRLWYRRTFAVPRAWAGRRTLLNFGAVDWEATVWVNGKELGTHQGGFDGFSYDITEALKAESENELIVRVFDPTDAGTQPRGKQVNKPGGIFYAPTTGIWQTVWIEPVGSSHIAALKVVPNVDGGKVSVGVVLGSGSVPEPSGWSVQVTASRNGKVVATNTRKNDGKPVELAIPDAALWTPETPHLYDLAVELTDGARKLDSVSSYFGMRSIAVARDEKGVGRLMLNSKPIFQVGPLDQGFWPDGLYTAPTDEALRFDIEITKRLGFNMTRKHVKVEPDRWYYWCDRLGLLVWQDMPSGDRSINPDQPDLNRSPESARQYNVELKAMIDGLQAHPSIVTWVVFNEGWGQFDTKRVADDQVLRPDSARRLRFLLGRPRRGGRPPRRPHLSSRLRPRPRGEAGGCRRRVRRAFARRRPPHLAEGDLGLPVDRQQRRSDQEVRATAPRGLGAEGRHGPQCPGLHPAHRRRDRGQRTPDL